MWLSWLPEGEDWDERLRAVEGLSAPQAAETLRALATCRLDLAQMARLDRVARRTFQAHGGALPGMEPVRMAILGSATISHLAAGIRVAGLRRGLAIAVYEGEYGMYWQELNEVQARGSGSSAQGPDLDDFAPEALLLALDARHVAAMGSAEAAVELMRTCWRQAKARFGCQVLQQAVLPVLPELMGNNEARLAHSPAALVSHTNALLRAATAPEAVELVAVDRWAAADGLRVWHDAGMWYRSKHEVHPRATALYGEQVARVIAAGRGRSAKCLVLDLDNTLWGGVIGDDGLQGIVLGQGSGEGEAFAEMQRYAKSLSERGVILAVCSKNDEAVALEAFARHPEMALRREDIACFVANWTDKATNLRTIANTLNIGLDALVFVDDNPVERALVRRELPMVMVPEMPEEPENYVATLAAAGYFEGLHVTEEDRGRSAMYRANAEREQLKDAVATTTDMRAYLQSLHMVLTVQPFDAMSLARVTQLINKTNQFNLTTERLSEAEVTARLHDPRVITLQARLSDRFGDNGIIAVLIARLGAGESGAHEATIETWLMSCRVLGRQVEQACLQVLVERCKAAGVQRLAGLYRPTAKNAMVSDLYARLGFSAVGHGADGETRWQLDLSGFQPCELPMELLTARETAA